MIILQFFMTVFIGFGYFKHGILFWLLGGEIVVM